MRNLFIHLIGLFFVLILAPSVCYGISAEELKEMLDRMEDITVIDVRNNSAYSNSHISRAVNIPARLCSVKKLPPVGRVIVYGDDLDLDSVKEAAEALNSKPGITAEMLEGGIGRWQSLNYPTTGEKGMEREKLPHITYKQLNKAVQSNQDIVFIDVRNNKKQTASQINASSASKADTGRPELLTNLSTEFPGVRVMNSPFASRSENEAHSASTSSFLRSGGQSHSKFYVLIDNGDGAAEKMARRLKAAGIKRFVILAGGEEILIRKGKPGKKKKVTSMDYDK